MKNSNTLFKPLTILILCFILAACASDGNPGLSAKGDGVMTMMDSEDYLEMKRVEAEAKAAEAYYTAQATRWENVTDPTAQLGMRAIDALDNKNQAPTNSNDVKIVEAQASVEKHKTWAGFGKDVVTGTILGSVAVKGLDTLGDLGAAALAKDSTVVNNTATEGSTIKGAIGTGNTYTETREEVGGIPLNPGNVADVALGTAASEEPGEIIPCVDVRPLDPDNPDEVAADEGGNNDGLVCSDGVGGFTENT